MTRRVTLSWLLGLLMVSYLQHSVYSVDIPDEPAITPTLEIGAKVIPTDKQESSQSDVNVERATTREAEVKAEKGEDLQLPTAALETNEDEILADLLRNSLLGDLGKNVIEDLPLGFYGPEASSE